MEELLSQTASGLPAKAMEVLPRLALALALGSALAYRPWLRRNRPKGEMVQTQVLMCVAAAMIACVIGDSLARAFGVVGLGGFIRFRSGLKDPRDAAVLFALIGLGMASGMGLTALAIAGAAFLAVVFAAIDLFTKRERPVEAWRLTFEADDLASAEASVSSALKAEGFAVRCVQLEAKAGRAVLELEGDAGALAALARVPWQGMRQVTWERRPQAPVLAAVPAATGGSGP